MMAGVAADHHRNLGVDQFPDAGLTKVVGDDEAGALLGLRHALNKSRTYKRPEETGD